jgi:hypothetical protein
LEYQTAKPLPIIIVANVTINAGILKKITENPLIIPNNIPIKNIIIIANGIAYGEPANTPLSFVIIDAPITLPKAIIEVHEKSILPFSTTKVTPLATTAKLEACIIIFRMFLTVRKLGTINMERIRNVIRIDKMVSLIKKFLI